MSKERKIEVLMEDDLKSLELMSDEIPKQYEIKGENASNRALVISEYFPDIEFLERINHICNKNGFMPAEFMQLDITDSDILDEVTSRVSSLAIGCIIVDNSSGRLKYLDNMTIELFRTYDVEIIDAYNCVSITNKYIAQKDSQNNTILLSFYDDFKSLKQMVNYAYRDYSNVIVCEIEDYSKTEFMEKIIKVSQIKNASTIIIPNKELLQFDKSELFDAILNLLEADITLYSLSEGYIDMTYYDEEYRQVNQRQMLQ